jgi:hypothetical protein
VRALASRPSTASDAGKRPAAAARTSVAEESPSAAIRNAPSSSVEAARYPGRSPEASGTCAATKARATP